MIRQNQVWHVAILAVILLVVLSYQIFRTPRKPHPAQEAAQEVPAPPPSPFPAGTVILHGALKDVKDSTPLNDADRDPAYGKLLENVSLLGPEALASSAEPEVRYATYIKYAPELRGRIFRVRGEVIQDSVVVPLFQRVGKTDVVWRIFLTDLDVEGGFVCDLIDRPAENFELRDRVEIEAMFYKIVRFQNTHNQDRDVPLLVGRTLRKIPPDPPTSKSLGRYLFDAVFVLGILVVLGLGYLSMRSMARDKVGFQPLKRLKIPLRPKRLSDDGKTP